MTNGEAQLTIDILTAGDSELRGIYGYFQSLGWEDKATLEKIELLQELKTMMKTDVVQFVFKKLNGEIRTAFGTRAQDVLTQNGSTPSGQKRCNSTFTYYDIEKKGWRSFKPELIQEVNLNYGL